MSDFPPTPAVAQSPHLVEIEQVGTILIVTLARAAKRNALNDLTVLELERVFTTLPADVKCVVLTGSGEHFCAGRELAPDRARDLKSVLAYDDAYAAIFERL